MGLPPPPSPVKNFERDERGTIKENLIIKGNNLLALHSLKKQFAGKIKLIYIDPPYNTGGEANIFTYNNNFNHSTWLTFMKNRLEVAKEFLREDGFIAIAIDHYELFYLGVLADEIFGRENRLGIVTMVHKPEGRQHSKFFSASNEFMIVYGKNKNICNFNKIVINNEKKQEFNEVDNIGNFKWKNFIRQDTLKSQKPKNYYPIYVSKDFKEIALIKKEDYFEIYPDVNNIEKVWNVLQESLEEKLNNNEVRAIKIQDKIIIQYKIREQEVFVTHWIGEKYNATAHGTNLLKKILGYKPKFSYPKSLYAVLDILKITTDKNDVILDFFAGSGTTGHAVLEQNKEDGGNRKFILVEQLEEHVKICKERIQKVLKKENVRDYFLFFELAKYNEEVIERIMEAADGRALLEIWADMCEKYFLNYNVKVKEFNENKKDFEKLSLKQQKEMLVKMLNKNQLYVNLSEIEDSLYDISEEDRELNKKFYGTD